MSSSPLKPTWVQPSHPAVQEVVINEAEFLSKSLSRVSLPPFGLFARMDFPPCTLADKATYATVQFGRESHLNLNSDLLYINHSCEPSLIFDTANFSIIAGPKGLQVGEELTFFYPSTEWSMAQPFGCLCKTPTCRGRISGAGDMTDAQLSGLWLNGHIRELRASASAAAQNGKKQQPEHGSSSSNIHQQDQDQEMDHRRRRSYPGSKEEEEEDQITQALRNTLHQAEETAQAARKALTAYTKAIVAQKKKSNSNGNGKLNGGGGGGSNGSSSTADNGYHHQEEDDGGVSVVVGSTRDGPTSRELAGEMGGDTTADV
ncbi:hypothetical protein B0H63DRAFT_150931 [Podospora didyma]|uniref:Post-SET domain-containing protein n=1 Tax=Podospora didyma TaxID=330526 RepID=A0AAE0NTD6_9PEZI|nr:hypothetical protein B0H63DRAFT_150931 [Podospora didyma]